METSVLRSNWREFEIRNSKGENPILLEKWLIRLLDEKILGEVTALEFEVAGISGEPVFLCADTVDGNSVCLKWNEDAGYWEELGFIFYKPTWGLPAFLDYWKICKIELVGPRVGLISLNKIIDLKDILEDKRLGEKNGGLCFYGKGPFADEILILKPDDEEQLKDFYDDQKCYRLDKRTDEWGLFGVLKKKRPQIRA